MKKKKQTENRYPLNREQKPKAGPSVQEWYPAADVRDNCIYMKSDELVGGFRIYPKTLSLLTEYQIQQLIKALSEAYSNVFEKCQQVSIGRPVDIENYLRWMDDNIKKAQDDRKKYVLQKTLQQNKVQVRSGSVSERRFYIMFSHDGTLSIDRDTFEGRMQEIEGYLGKALNVERLKNDEILNLLKLFGRPDVASDASMNNMHDLNLTIWR